MTSCNHTVTLCVNKTRSTGIVAVHLIEPSAGTAVVVEVFVGRLLERVKPDIQWSICHRANWGLEEDGCVCYDNNKNNRKKHIYKETNINNSCTSWLFWQHTVSS